MIVSMLGGILSSAFILVGVVFLARAAQSRNWDMDAIGSPIITATGDIVTLPALVLATFAITRFEWLNITLGGLLFATALVAVYAGYRNRNNLTRSVVRESIPVLTYAAVVDILAGAVLEVRIESFVTMPGLLVLIPPFIASCGSLGGILSARLGSDLHLGLISARRLPEKRAGLEGSMTVLFAILAFTGVGAMAHLASIITGLESPGVWSMIGISLAGGAIAFVLLFFVAYYAATATYRFGLDPDNHGIPIVTATMDLSGVICLVVGMYAFGVI